MKAIVIRQFGNPGVLNLEDVPQPTLEAGEIAIKVRAATVNQTLDVALRAGKYARQPPLPHVPGSDAAGEVTAVATDVKTIKLGDRVVCHPIVGRQPNGALKLLGVDTWGTYAEFVKVPASTVQILPDMLDFITAAVVGRTRPRPAQTRRMGFGHGSCRRPGQRPGASGEVSRRARHRSGR